LTYRILIADDHAVVRDGLKRILLQEGFEISAEASDGREAVDMVCQSHPDVALLDIDAPTLDQVVNRMLQEHFDSQLRRRLLPTR